MVRTIYCLVALLSCAATASADELHAQLNAAVVAGSLEQLEALRETVPEQDVYLRSYIEWRMGQRMPRDSRDRKRMLKAADRRLSEALEVDPDDFHLLSLLGGIQGDRITGMMNGITLGPRSSANLERARELAPDDPRVALLLGINLMFKPESFGGGAEAAEKALLEAIGIYEARGNEAEWPNWGWADAYAWHGQALAALGRSDEALSRYQQALNTSPGYRWVEQVLIPALGNKSKS